MLSKLRLLPPAFIYAIFFCLGGIVSSMILPQTPNQPPIFIQSDQWLINLSKKWFTYLKSIENFNSLKLAFVKIESNRLYCREKISALSLHSIQKASYIISIDAFIKELHQPLIDRLISSQHRQYQFVTTKQASILPFCFEQPKIKYGKLR